MASPVTVRPAAGGDADSVVDLWTECFVLDPTGSRTEPYTLEDYERSAARGELLVAEVDSTVIGVAALFAPGAAAAWVADTEAEISRLSVSRSARRAGAGRALIVACGARAGELAADAIVLWTRPAQTGAHALYESLGYRRVPARDSENAHGRRLIYRLVLGGSRPARDPPAEAS
jgi:ribosomal protein S18 acetylase RimI-like enzyme